MPTPRPAIVIVLDDLISSGRTMQLSLEAIRQAGIMALGMAFSGHLRRDIEAAERLCS